MLSQTVCLLSEGSSKGLWSTAVHSLSTCCRMLAGAESCVPHCLWSACACCACRRRRTASTMAACHLSSWRAAGAAPVAAPHPQLLGLQRPHLHPAAPWASLAMGLHHPPAASGTETPPPRSCHLFQASCHLLLTSHLCLSHEASVSPSLKTASLKVWVGGESVGAGVGKGGLHKPMCVAIPACATSTTGVCLCVFDLLSVVVGGDGIVHSESWCVC